MTSSLRASMIFMIFLNIFPDSGGSNDFLIFFNLLLGKPKDIFPLIAGKITGGIVEAVLFIRLFQIYLDGTV